MTDSSVPFIAPYNLLKPVAWNHPEQLMKNRVSVLHGLYSPGYGFAVTVVKEFGCLTTREDGIRGNRAEK